MDDGDTRVERGSGNVFRDIGHPDPETHLLKAELVTRIDEIIRERRMKQVEAAKLLGLSQPDISRLLRGNFRDYSVERLLRLLTALGRECSDSHPAFAATEERYAQHRCPRASMRTRQSAISIARRCLRPKSGVVMPAPFAPMTTTSRDRLMTRRAVAPRGACG